MNFSWGSLVGAVGSYFKPNTGSRRSSRRDGRPGEDALPSPPTSSREPPSSAVESVSRRAPNGRPAGAGYQDTSRTEEIARRDLQQRVEELRFELDRVKKELSLTKQELESTRVFANKADAISETDIIGKLNSVNDAVYQLASAIAEAHENKDIRVSTNAPRGKAPQFTVAETRATRASTDIPTGKTVQYFDESVGRLVMNVKREPTHARVLVSLQACMNHFCVMVLSSEFSSVVNRERTEVLQQIFDDMKASQPKAVSARWRSLAYSHNQVLMQDQQKLYQFLSNGIRTLYGFPKEVFESTFGEDLSELVNKTLDLRKMMYGDYVSGDVEVFSPLPGSQFDSVRTQVDDPKGNGRSPATGRIICTTTIGIARRLYIRRLQADNWVNKEEYNVLRKANVLMSFDD